MKNTQTESLEISLRLVRLPESALLIGRQIIVKLSYGTLRTSILSVSDANDSGFVELAVSPVYANGDLVTHVVFADVEDHRIRTTYFSNGGWQRELINCFARIV